MKDYLIVGFGLAGLNIAQELTERKKSYQIIDNGYFNASQVAGGVLNPLILKRFTKVWKADEFLPVALVRYRHIENQLQEHFLHKTPIYRKIKSIQEQNDWFVAADKPSLATYMTPALQQLQQLPSALQYGEIQKSWLLDTEKMLSLSRAQHLDNGTLTTENFSYSELKIHPDFIAYKKYKARKIIFCEGIQLQQNPYFKALPLIGNKGEYLLLKIPGLQVKKIIKTALALIPLGNDYYKFGATYSRAYRDTQPEEQSLQFLLEKLKQITTLPYTVVDQVTGVRPTVLDRRPFIGAHHRYDRLLILNGLGSHGILMAPLAAKWLLEFDLDGTPLPKAVNVQRYPK